MTVETIAFGNKHTPDQTLIDAREEAVKAKAAIVILLTGDDYVTTSWSDSPMLKRLGMLDIAKLQIIEAAQEAG